ncbi:MULTISPECIES: class I adenylate-forming enzyme family protein [Acidobacteriaceae]|uniref:class I adenylate-forming enzyme family protein n=1 Tax=Acidobacteriaceae TaxID=204434 RepID=UPI00131DC88D|nr:MULTISPECIES: AMP-binding protein [Acidobacteriaceae]MDW5265030.1 AMP-binding protein [Edaphobacter sp.]
MLNQVFSDSNGIAYAPTVVGGSACTLPFPSGGVAGYLLEGKDASRIALESGNDLWTFGDLDSASLKLSSFLLASGINKGDHVLLIADNSYFWVASYLAILRAGLVCIPLPMSTSGQDLGFVVQSTKAQFAFVDTKFLARNAADLPQTCIVSQAPASLDAFQRKVYVFEHLLYSEARQAEFPRLTSSDVAALMFTSGSTGKPRGVMVTHGNIVSNTKSIIECLNLTENDSMFTVLPLHYCFGTSLLHTHLAVGGKLVLDNRFMYTEAFLQHLRNSRCTGFAGVPSHYQILLRRSNIHTMKFPYLRYVQQAGGHMAPAFIRELGQALPDTKIFVMYGQTEATARLSCVPPEMLEKKMGSIGRAIPGVTLTIVDAQGNEVGANELGEIVAEGPNIAMGYWEEPEETAATFRKGKLYTGDLATVDEDGFINIVDRARDFVKIGGTRTSCRGLEEQMLEFSGLLEVAVVGVADAISGEALRAFVVPRDRSDDQFLQGFRTFCAERLPLHYLPKEIIQLNALPKNSAGKVMKSGLKSFEHPEPKPGVGQ